MSDTEEVKGQTGENAGEEEVIDANVYNEDNELVSEGAVEQHFQCFNPQNINGHIVYSCKGMDSKGSWEGTRRFNEFDKLHEILENRWPGVPIPNIPPKKAFNKDIKFISERRFYLERFMKKLAPFNFVIESSEFQVFARPNADIGKAFAKIPRASTGEIVDKMQNALGIQDHMYDMIQKESLDSVCKEFQHFAKTILPTLKEMLKKISAFMVNHSQSIVDQKAFLNMLEKYEDLNLTNYVDGDMSLMVFNAPDQQENKDGQTLKDMVISTSDNLKNPYFNLYHWIKGEKYDIEAL